MTFWGTVAICWIICASDLDDQKNWRLLEKHRTTKIARGGHRWPPWVGDTTVDLFWSHVMGIAPGAAAVMMAAAGGSFAGGYAGILLTHVVGIAPRAATVVMASCFGIGLLTLRHRRHRDERKRRGGDQKSAGDDVCFSG